MILRLRNNIKDVTGQLNHSPRPTFDEGNNEKVAKLLNSLELMLFEGIRTREFDNKIPFWSLLERIGTQEAGLRHSVIKDTVLDIDASSSSSSSSSGSSGSLFTGIGKARGWLRYVLNNGYLASCLELLKDKHKILTVFFTNRSIFSQPDEFNTFINMVRALKVVPFALHVYDKNLNTCEWLDRLVMEQIDDHNKNLDACAISIASCLVPQKHRQPPQKTHTNTLSSSSSSSSSSSLLSLNCMSSMDTAPSSSSSKYNNSMDSFLLRFESQFDELTAKVNDLATSCFSNNHSYDQDDNHTDCNDPSDDPILELAENTNKVFMGVGLALTGFMEGLHQSMYEGGSADMSLFVDPGSTLPVPSLFGSHLRDLVNHEHRCPHAFVEPRLGVPRQILMLINTLSGFLDTNFLFKKQCSANSMSYLRAQLDAEKGIKKGTEVHVIAMTLLHWLHTLPEPLLGYASYDAFLACMGLEKDDDKVRNLSLLIQEQPWYSKSLVMKMLPLLYETLLSKNADSNGLSYVSVSILFTPVLLRSDTLRNVSLSTEEGEKNAVIAAATGSNAVSFLIKNQAVILKPLKEELMTIQKHLNNKVMRINKTTDLITKIFLVEQQNDVNSTDEDGHINESYKAALALWKALEISERLILLNSEEVDNNFVKGPKKNDDSNERQLDNFIALVSQSRWDICGFPPVIQDKQALLVRKNSMNHGIMNSDEINDLNPLYCFEHKKNGHLAVTLLTSFLVRHREKAAMLVKRFAETRRRYCSLVHVCLQLAWFVTDALKLTPLCTNASDTIPFLAKQNSWNILSEEKCIEELFNLALFTFDDIWTYFTDKVQIKPSLQIHEICTLSTRSMLVELLESDLKSVEQMWGLWSEQRVRRQMAAVSRMERS